MDSKIQWHQQDGNLSLFWARLSCCSRLRGTQTSHHICPSSSTCSFHLQPKKACPVLTAMSISQAGRGMRRAFPSLVEIQCRSHTHITSLHTHWPERGVSVHPEHNLDSTNTLILVIILIKSVAYLVTTKC